MHEASPRLPACPDKWTSNPGRGNERRRRPQRPNQAAVAGQTAANDRDAWQVRAGLNFRSSGALYGGIVLSSDVGRSQVKNDQIMVNVGMRF